MADTISLTLKGAVQSDIHGDNLTPGRLNTIEVLSLTHAVRSSFDRATGLSNGRRYYEPITFVKPIDQSSPKLRKALVTNENIVTGKFEWFRPNPNGNGTTEQFFTMEFSDGRVVSAEARLPNTLEPGNANLPPVEEIKLVFNKIKWTFMDGGIEHEDM